MSVPVRRLRAGLCAAAALAALAPPALAVPSAPVRAPAAAAAAASPLTVTVGRATNFSRVEFRWAGGPARLRHALRGRDLVLRFDRPAQPNLARLRIDPPPFVEGVETATVNGGLELRLRLAENADYRVGQADGATYVNVFARQAAATADSATVQAAAPRANPAPTSGVVPVELDIDGADAALTFRWAAPAGAAVFRRGEAIWIVFDAAARLDTAQIPRGLRQIRSVQALQGPDWSALRIVAPPTVMASAVANDAAWTVRLGPGLGAAPPQPVRVTRAETSGPPVLEAALGGVSAVRWIEDPAVRDRLAVATALGPARGVAGRREFVEFALLPSTHGLAVEPAAGDLVVNGRGDLVAIGRPRGLALSAHAAQVERAEPTVGLPRAASMPALIDPVGWSRTGEGGFLARYAELQRLAAAEGAAGEGAGVTGRMALARFLVGSGLSFEAIGVLNALARSDSSVLQAPEVRGLRGVARVMAGRYEEAQADFAHPVLSDDPSSALWRAYVAAEQSDWAAAREQHAGGAQAFALAPPEWRARFARAQAEAAGALGDFAAAHGYIRTALQDGRAPLEQLETRLVQAALFAADGRKDSALAVYQAVARAPVDRLAAPALLRATELQLELGRVQPAQAAQVFDALRYRWRGDGTEMETVRALGRLYLGVGRYREALEALRSVGTRLPDSPVSIDLQRDMAGAFRALFLDGLADRLQPVQALALFYDFRDMTPIGADGDQMVRRLSDRLVTVDLLDPAAELLRYQVDNRLDGVAKASVATELATLYLMNRRPQDALVAINSSRTTVLPVELSGRRRVVEARALTQLGRYDHALELLADAASPDAQELRAEIAWGRRAWPEAASRLEAALGDRWRQPGPLAPETEQRLLRAAIAYSLADDAGALARLRERWRGFVDASPQPDALRVALSGTGEGVGAADFARVVADTDSFTGWVSQMKARMRERATAGPQAQAAAAPRTAAAG